MSDSASPSTLIEGPQSQFTTNKDQVRTDPREQEAIYEIMRATGNDWATEIPDVCGGRWHGIECMPDKDRVYHVISLSFGALSDDTAFPTCDPTKSYIPESITRLTQLRTLFFYRCFSNNPQPIPAFLGRLGQTLQTLVLRENGLLGPIPIEVGNITHLKVLDLHKNNLTSPIPVSLGRLMGLRSLDLSSNKLTGSIPNFSLPALNVVDLSQNLLSGSIPSSLGTCHSIIKMDFSHNRLTGPIPKSVQGLKELILMDLSYNLLTGPLPISIQTLKSLEAMNLQGNPMESLTNSNDIFDGLNSLMILILSNMNLNGEIPESLGCLPNLRVVHLDQNRFNGSIPISFRNLKHLSELRLNDNQLTGAVPFEKDMVWRMKRKLRLYNNAGLCYASTSGIEDGLDSSFDSAIGLCGTATPSSEGTVQHLSRSMNVAAGAAKKSSVLLRYFQFVGLATLSLFLS
ncbi:hypothetical protein ACFE04_015819 [Oxalis oulophora]